MAFKRCTRIVYNTLAEDFDDLDGMFFDFVPGDFFIVWCRFTNYKTFPKEEINEDGVYSQYTWAGYKKRRS